MDASELGETTGLETVASKGEAASSKRDHARKRGSLIGRYVVLEELGRGGMGVVYTAYDPELDRKVALKLVLVAPSKDTSQGATRMQREAQALAKLSHRNVVGVHDVGVHEGQVFIAMEFVRGATLRGWLDETKRSNEEILEVFRQAGEGMRAAHEAGLVHRDFKPDNVLISEKGRAVVMDFGLARAEAEDGGGVSIQVTGMRPNSDAISTPLTATGAVMGTPAYMAPEQHLGLAADARADQFAFCVALYEALCGQRPFKGDNVAALALQVTQGNLRPFPKEAEVPSKVQALIRRGLDVDPEERWPDMGALLGALAPSPESSGGNRLVVGVVGVVAAALLAALFLREDEGSLDPCASEAMGETWNEGARAEIHEAFSAAKLSDEAARDASSQLDAWAGNWEAMRRESCEATNVRHEQSAELMDLRSACLQRRHGEFEATIDLLAEGDVNMLAEAGAAIGSIGGLEACADAEALRARVALPESAELDAAVQKARERIDRAEVHRLAGAYAKAEELLAEVGDEHPALAYAPLAAELAFARASLLAAKGEYEEAAEAYPAAATAAARARDDRLVARNWIALANLTGKELGETERARQLAEVAQSAIARVGDAPELEFERRFALVSAERVGGHPDLALKLVDELIGDLENSGEDHPLLLASARGNKAAILANLDRSEEAIVIQQAELEAAEERLGPVHPRLIRMLVTLGGTYTRLNRADEAREVIERGLAIADATVGKDHPLRGLSLEGFGVHMAITGDHHGANEKFSEALRIYRLARDPAHPDIVRVTGNLGTTLQNTGRVDEAQALYEASLATLVERYGEDHDYTVFLNSNLAVVHYEAERYDEAEKAIAWARRVALAKYGPDHEKTAETWVMEAELERKRGNLESARELLAKGRQAYGRSEAPTAKALQVDSVLVSVLADTPGRRGEAKALLVQTHRSAIEAGPTAALVVEACEKQAAEYGWKLALPDPAATGASD